jgi:hypothetical protein
MSWRAGDWLPLRIIFECHSIERIIENVGHVDIYDKYVGLICGKFGCKEKVINGRRVRRGSRIDYLHRLSWNFQVSLNKSWDRILRGARTFNERISKIRDAKCLWRLIERKVVVSHPALAV